MADNSAGDHLAILIDGDNVSSKIVAGLMTEVAKYGTASVRRIYGDWTSPNMRSWRECLLEYSIVPIQQFAYTTGKNATDGAMIIDAMDLMYSGRFASFCLVSSDSDFTRLAARIREQGISVYGFGNRNNTHRAFVAACSEFVYFDALTMSAEEPAAPEPSTPQKASTGGVNLSTQAPSSVRQTTTWNPPTGPRMVPGYSPFASSLALRPAPSIEPKPRSLDQPALDGLRRAIGLSSNYEDDYVNLAEVGLYLKKISPDLDPRNYGYARLRPFIEASGIVESKTKSMGNAPPIALVRLRRQSLDTT